MQSIYMTMWKGTSSDSPDGRIEQVKSPIPCYHHQAHRFLFLHGGVERLLLREVSSAFSVVNFVYV